MTGAVSAPDGAARQVYVLDLVGGERLASAVSLNEVVINVSRVLGPAAGGLFLATLGIPFCFVANAASYVPPLVVLLTRSHRRAARPAPAHTAPSRRGAIRAGLRYAWSTPALRACLLMAAASGMLFNLGVALPLLATRSFHLGGAGYGLMMATFGLGGVAGALLAASGRGVPSGRSVRLLGLLTGVSILMTAASPLTGLAFAGLGVTGCLSIWFIARANTLAQLRAMPSMRGRVMGLWVMALPGAQPITSPVVGVTAEVAGPRAGFGLAGAALLVAVASGWRALDGAGRVAEPLTAPPAAPDRPVLGDPGLGTDAGRSPRSPAVAGFLRQSSARTGPADAR